MVRDVRWPTANLRGQDLTGWDFSGANLRGADLSEAALSGANFSGANLQGAHLTRATCTGANFSGADLTRVRAGLCDFSGADLTDANLFGARCEHAIFDDAKLGGANLTGLVPASTKDRLISSRSVSSYQPGVVNVPSPNEQRLSLTDERTIFHSPNGDTREVVNRFSWSAFAWGILWGPLWALYRRFWLPALVLLVVKNLWIFVLQFDPNAATFALFFLGGAAANGILCGMFEHRWERSRLIKRGFVPQPVEPDVPEHKPV